METKKISSSKTVWFNVITTIVGGLALITPILESTGLAEEQKVLVLAVVTFVQGIGNLVLRTFFTSSKIDL